MANDTFITVTGNLTADPELRFTKSGVAVTNFTVASTSRRWDRQRNEYVDEEPLFVRCNVWREMAENVAETLTKGARALVHGRMKASTFDTKEGDRRTVWEVDVEEVGPALRFATARVQRAGRNNGGGSTWGGHQTTTAVATGAGWDTPPVGGEPPF
ncbi:single-stranded DNA-binding protein [Nesterenkonia sp. HG001]|uniref:single-stranded DNA-binding protein n=1 Tax=Nesterenkonia sp. HG001 TaxID=2983207 RepID=UPI002ACC18D0|nr:single-stranded DNA-binding protein [Nesterenkonia sp. HG001]